MAGFDRLAAALGLLTLGSVLLTLLIRITGCRLTASHRARKTGRSIGTVARR